MYAAVHSEAVGGGSANPFRLASLTVIIHIFSPTYVLLNALYLYPMKAYKGDPVRQDNTSVKPFADPNSLKLLGERKPSHGLSIPDADHIRVPTSSLKPLDFLKSVYNQHLNDSSPDTVFENVLEYFDSSGIMSHDDAKEAIEEYRQSKRIIPTFNQAVDVLGAVPDLTGAKASTGPLRLATNPKLLKKLMEMINAYDSGQDIHQDNLQ